jgi:hypothetical protein
MHSALQTIDISFAMAEYRSKTVIESNNAKIKLPATPQGEPDWEFMENYIKSLPYSSSL